MAILDRGALLTPSDLKRITEPVGPLGGEVNMQELSVAERLRIKERYAKNVDTDNEEQATRFLMVMVVASLRNEDWSVMFAPEEWDESVEGLLAHNGPAIDALVAMNQKLHGQTEDALKEAVKNSEAIRSEPGFSGSPETPATPTSAP